MSNLFEIHGAEFSPCMKHRYALWRIWDDAKPKVMFIGLNPSKAGSDNDDPTIQSVRRISEHNGFGGFYMLNLFTYISTDPDELIDMTGTDPNIFTKYWAQTREVVFAWGNFKQAKNAAPKVIDQYPYALCIGKNKNGSPKHPLFIKGKTELVKFAL